eukprot:64816-Chlamydomonas_euryale.AAC.1
MRKSAAGPTAIPTARDTSSWWHPGAVVPRCRCTDASRPPAAPRLDAQGRSPRRATWQLAPSACCLAAASSRRRQSIHANRRIFGGFALSTPLVAFRRHSTHAPTAPPSPKRRAPTRRWARESVRASDAEASGEGPSGSMSFSAFNEWVQEQVWKQHGH